MGMRRTTEGDHLDADVSHEPRIFAFCYEWMYRSITNQRVERGGDLFLLQAQDIVHPEI
jgi:hypothetical protein